MTRIVLLWIGAAGMLGLVAGPPPRLRRGRAPTRCRAAVRSTPPLLVVDGQTVIAAVNRRPTSSPTTLEVAQFVPTVLTDYFLESVGGIARPRSGQAPARIMREGSVTRWESPRRR